MAMFSADVLIVGGSFGGVAAAMAASDDPKVSVTLLEPSTWIGGQATSQGVTRWDESSSGFPDTSGTTKAYRYVKHCIRAWYRDNVALSPAGQNQHPFNPGFSQTGFPFSVDPTVTLTVLRELLAGRSNLDVRLETTVASVLRESDRVIGVVTTNGDRYNAEVVLDATDLGDLLPLAKIPFVTGAEPRSETGEPNAPLQAQPRWIQPVTVPIALELRPDGESHVIPKPPNYEAIVASQKFHVWDGDIHGILVPGSGGSESLFAYRQYVDEANFADPGHSCSRTTLNVGSNDYMAATLPTGSSDEDRRVYEGARDVSIAFAYWLQTEAPRDDGSGKGYPNLMIRADAFGTADGCAPQAYIRESRRIHAVESVRQQDIDADFLPRGSSRAKHFNSSCGIGLYAIDVHAETGAGTPWVGIPHVLPFQIPLGALLPKTVDGFVAACKNIGTTHLTSGAYRVHPVEWAIGEAAGVLAAFCVTQKVSPQAVAADLDRTTSYQYRLLARGIPIFWWSDILFEDDARTYAAVHFCGVKGAFSGAGAGLAFDSSDPAGRSTRAAVEANLGQSLPWPARLLTRGEAAVFIAEQMKWPID